jgi:type II secretory pathway pseudopilin PulG
MTLVEVIVAATLALIGFLVALVLYSAARNLFKKGEQATDQQQEGARGLRHDDEGPAPRRLQLERQRR